MSGAKPNSDKFNSLEYFNFDCNNYIKAVALAAIVKREMFSSAIKNKEKPDFKTIFSAMSIGFDYETGPTDVGIQCIYDYYFDERWEANSSLYIEFNEPEKSQSSMEMVKQLKTLGKNRTKIDKFILGAR